MTDNKPNKLIDTIKNHFESKSTEDLLEIWENNNKEAYSKEAFVAIELILNDRNVTLPAQSAHEQECVVNSTENLDAICKKRKWYLISFLIMLVSCIGLVISDDTKASSALVTTCWTTASVSLLLFLFFFLTAIRKLRGYGMGTLFIMTLGLVIPILTLLILLSADLDIYSSIVQKKLNSGQLKRAVSPLSIYSLLFSYFPIIGLPMVFFAFREISKSEGKLYGITLACISMAINLLVILSPILFIIIEVVFFLKQSVFIGVY